MATMMDAIRSFERVAGKGSASPAYKAAVAGFARVDVESLEDVSSLLAIAAAAIRAGHIETGATMVERGQAAVEQRLVKLRPPLRLAR